MQSLLQDLEEHVNTNGCLRGATDIVRNFDIKSHDLQKYMIFNDDKYTRNIVCESEKILILIICWKAGQGSPIHNHPAQGCIMRMLHGSLHESQFDLESLESLSETIHTEGNVSYIDDQTAYHKIENNTDTPAVSLHCYSPREFTPTIFS